jgi:hypothetical protein
VQHDPCRCHGRRAHESAETRSGLGLNELLGLI